MPSLRSLSAGLALWSSEARKRRHIYASASLWLDRKDLPFPSDRTDQTRPLFYCALGSLVWFSKEKYRKFFQTTIEVIPDGPQRQWVIATGAGLNPEDFEPGPGNTVIVKQAPQLELLQRAQMMVTHGGANAVKECAFFRVPMISFLLGYHHPGITARMVDLGLGVRGEIRKLSVPYLKKLILKVEGSTAIRESVSRIDLLHNRHAARSSML